VESLDVAVAEWKLVPSAVKNSILNVLLDRRHHHLQVVQNCAEYPIEVAAVREQGRYAQARADGYACLVRILGALQ